MDTLERILELQKQSGLTVKALEAATGISNGSFSKWKKGTYAPSAEAVLRLAKYFHVSTDYLFCLSDSPYPKVEISLTEREQLSERVLSPKYSVMRDTSESTPSMTTGQRTLYLLLLTKTFGIGCNLESVRLKMHLPGTKQK